MSVGQFFCEDAGAVKLGAGLGALLCNTDSGGIQIVVSTPFNSPKGRTGNDNLNYIVHRYGHILTRPRSTKSLVPVLCRDAEYMTHISNHNSACKAVMYAFTSNSARKITSTPSGKVQS